MSEEVRNLGDGLEDSFQAEIAAVQQAPEIR